MRSELSALYMHHQAPALPHLARQVLEHLHERGLVGPVEEGDELRIFDLGVRKAM